MPAHRLDRTEARRVAVRAQLLDARRPADLLAVVNQLPLLQLDPTAAVAPNADLVAFTRLGPAYRPAADGKARVLRVTAIHEDVPFTAATTAVRAELDALAQWLDLDREPA